MSCEYCRQYPHHPRCPEAPPPPIYARCDSCGTKIYDGDEYYEIEGNNYCEACVQGSYKTAEVEDY